MFKWMDRVYVNARKKIFKNIDTGEILNLELQDDPDNISQDSETPITAHCLNQAQQELIDDLGKTFKDTNITAPTVAGWGRIKKLYGRTVEEGTGEKSPGNPYTLKCVGDDVNLLNLKAFNDGSTTRTHNGITYKIVNETLSISGTATAESYAYFDISTLANLELNKNYAFVSELKSGTIPSGLNLKVAVASNAYFASNIQNNKIVKSLTEAITAFSVVITSGTTVNMSVRLKIAKSDVFVPYSSYGYGTIENISTDGTNTSSNILYVDKPLCSIGDVRDELDYTNKKITRRCSSYVLDGSVNPYYIEKYDGYTRFDFDFTGRINPILSTSKLISDKMKISSVGGLGNTTEYIGFSNSNSYKIYLYVKNTRLATIDNAGIVSYLEENPIKIIYATNPYEKDIECSDKIVQFADSTNVYNKDGADIEVELTNNDTISGLNENIESVEEAINNTRMKTYTSPEQFGLTTYTTLAEVCEAMPNGSILVMASAEANPFTDFTLMSNGTYIITKHGSYRCVVEVVSSESTMVGLRYEAIWRKDTGLSNFYRLANISDIHNEIKNNYGLGGICKVITGGNLNTVCGTKTGFYMGLGLTNSPTSNNQEWFFIIHMAHNSMYQHQIAMSFNSSLIYNRFMRDGTWSTWASR